MATGYRTSRPRDGREGTRPKVGRAGLIAFLSTAVVLAIPSSAIAVLPAGNQLRLDGVNDYANISDNASLDLGDAEGEDFTIEAFVYVPDETSDANQVVFFKQNAYRLSVNFNVSPTADVLIFGVWPAPIGSGDQLLTSHDVTAGWHHIAAVFDNEFSASNDRLSIFFDGAMVGDNTGAVDYSPGIFNSTNVLSVGANSGAVPWNGWMDEARFSDSVRYSAAYTVPTSPFVADASTRALWHFDDPACSTSFADSSGNGNTLAGQNGALTGVQGAASPSLRFSTASPSVNEGAGSATINVVRDGDPLPAVGVNHQASDGTAGSSDYSGGDGSLNLPCGDMSESFTVSITQDSEIEPDETVALSLDSPTGGASLGNPSMATLTILDDDPEDTTPPDPPEVTDTDPNSPANDNNPEVKGTAEPGSTVKLYTTSDCSGSPAATGPASNFASPGLTVSVGNNTTTTFRATATDAALNTSVCSPSSVTYVEDSTPPSSPTLTDTDPDSPANDNNPEVKGTAEPGSTVKLYTTSDCSGSPAATGPASNFASPGLTVSVGNNTTTTFRATATDAAGNASGCSAGSITYVEDSTPPATPTITDTDPNSPADDTNPEVKGSAEAGSTVKIYTTGNCSGSPAATGPASTFASPGLTVTVPQGATTLLSARATDQAGNDSSCSTSVSYIEANYRPDSLIKLGSGAFVGEDVYNTTGAGQTRSTKAKRGQTKTFTLRVENDGTVSDSFTIKGTGGSSKWVVKYFAGGTNVTGQVVAGTYSINGLAPGDGEAITLKIKPKAGANVGSKRTVSVTATSAEDVGAKDVVKAKVRVRS